MGREPAIPFQGDDRIEGRLPEEGRLNRYKAMKPGWHCRWCDNDLIEMPELHKAIVCVDCDAPKFTTTE